MGAQPELWYRFEDRYCSGTVAYQVDLRVFKVVKYTNQGVWISPAAGYGWKKWVSRFARKRFAYPTIDEARQAYIIRKNWHERHAQNSLDRARQCRAMVEAGHWNKPYDPFLLISP